MEEQVISFETAKLAKLKDFPLSISQNKKYYSIGGYIHSLDFFKGLSPNEIIPAPTQSLLQRWLRDVHKIHLVCWWYDKNDKFYTELGRKGDNIIRVQTGDTTKLFNTYEEALEAGLLAALKLIK